MHMNKEEIFCRRHLEEQDCLPPLLDKSKIQSKKSSFHTSTESFTSLGSFCRIGYLMLLMEGHVVKQQFIVFVARSRSLGPFLIICEWQSKAKW